MIIIDKDGMQWALGDCSDISLARVLLKKDDNTYYIGIFLNGEHGYHQIPFATKEKAEDVLRYIDEKMERPLMCVHSTNHWNPAHNVPPLTKPLSEILKAVSEPREMPPLHTLKTTNLSHQPDVTSGQQYVNNYPNPEELNKRVDNLLATSNKI